jgi:tetratricopeptide (TPR) repeat protein
MYRFVSRRSVALIAALTVVVACVCLWPVVRVEWLVRKARHELLQRRVAEAIDLLTTAVGLRPEDARVQFLLARSCRYAGDGQRAAKYLNAARALGFAPQRVETERLLLLAQAGRMREAEQELPRLLVAPGADGREICAAFSSGFFLTYRFHEALRLLDAWQADYPDDSDPRVFRGIYWQHMMRWPESADEYRAALRLAPERHDVRIRLATVLVSLHEYDEALRSYRQVLTDTPESSEAMSGLGNCLLATGQHTEAADVFGKLLKRSPDDFEALLGMGRVHLERGDASTALPLLEKAVQIRGWYPAARFGLAQALQELGDDRAAEHFQYFDRFQQAQLALGRKMATLQEQPTDTELRFDIGTTILEYGDPAEAVPWIQSVLDQQPEHAGAHRELAAYFKRTGDLELAEFHAQRSQADVVQD